MKCSPRERTGERERGGGRGEGQRETECLTSEQTFYKRNAGIPTQSQYDGTSKLRVFHQLPAMEQN